MMEWIIEKPTLYVLEKTSSSDGYETWLSIATLPRKYFLFSYLGISATALARLPGSAEERLETIAKQIYARGGGDLAALPTSQARFRDCALVNNDRIRMEIPLQKEAQAGRINVAYWDEAVGRPVHKMSDQDLNALVETICKRQSWTRVIWEVTRSGMDYLPDLRVTTPIGPVVWA